MGTVHKIVGPRSLEDGAREVAIAYAVNVKPEAVEVEIAPPAASGTFRAALQKPGDERKVAGRWLVEAKWYGTTNSVFVVRVA